MLLLGHRGCRTDLTENTFAAFDHALDSGCDGFEFDVRRTSDAVPVIWHDARLRGRFISRQSFGSLCERCSKASRIRRSPVVELCQLEALLARYAHVAWMDIELKVRGLEEQVAGLLRRYPPSRGFLISSFRRQILLDIYRIDPSLPLGFIFERIPRAKVWSGLPVQFVKPNVRLVTPARVRQFHASGKKVLTWTVNHPGAIRRLMEAGVDGMIGDDPAMLAQKSGRSEAVGGGRSLDQSDFVDSSLHDPKRKFPSPLA